MNSDPTIERIIDVNDVCCHRMIWRELRLLLVTTKNSVPKMESKRVIAIPKPTQKPTSFAKHTFVYTTREEHFSFVDMDWVRAICLAMMTGC